MTIRDALNIWRRNIVTIIVIPLLLALGAWWFTNRYMVDTYSATTTLYILISQEQEISSYNSSSLSANMSVSEQIANDVSQLILSERARTLVEDYLDDDDVAPYSVAAVTGDDSRILRIAVSSYDPNVVADVANALAKVAAELAENIMNVESINVIDVATTPRVPSGPNRTLYIAGAGAAGLFCTAVLMLVVVGLDTKVRTVRDAERASGFTGIGRVPLFKFRGGRKAKKTEDRNAQQARDARDAVMTSLTNLLFLDSAKKVRTLTVCSPEDEEGRSTVACLAAQVLAASGDNVLLMEGDLNNRSLADMLDVHPEFGINAVSMGSVRPNDAIRPTKQSNLYFMDFEQDTPNATSLLSSKGFRSLLKALRRTYDYIIIDTPPANSFVYAAVLASQTDATILIARQGITRRDEMSEVARRLKQVGVSCVGVILNGAKVTHEERKKERLREKKRLEKEGTSTLAAVAMREDVVNLSVPEVPTAAPEVRGSSSEDDGVSAAPSDADAESHEGPLPDRASETDGEGKR